MANQIVVTGANGQLGRAIVAELRSRIGGAFRVSVRKPELAADLAAAGIGVRPGDYSDLDAMIQAFEGADSVLLISGDAPNEARIQHHRNAIDAARKAGVTHLAYTSILDVGAESSFTFAPIHRDTEAYLADSGLNVTLFRPSLYVELNLMFAQAALATGKLSIPAGSGAVSFISRGDIARAIAAVLVTPDRQGQTYELTGPTAYRFSDVAVALSEALQQPIAYDDCAPAVFAAGLRAAGFPDFVVEAMVSMGTAIQDNRFATVSPAVADLTGSAAEDALAFLRRTAPSLLAA